MATKKTTGKTTKTSKPKKPATTTRQMPPAKRTATATATARPRDPNAPAVGAVLHRSYKGKDHQIRVLADGYEFDGRTFNSLTALAKHITGYASISGPVWLGLAGSKSATKPEA